MLHSIAIKVLMYADTKSCQLLHLQMYYTFYTFVYDAYTGAQQHQTTSKQSLKASKTVSGTVNTENARTKFNCHWKSLKIISGL